MIWPSLPQSGPLKLRENTNSVLLFIGAFNKPRWQKRLMPAFNSSSLKKCDYFHSRVDKNVVVDFEWMSIEMEM